MQNYPKIQSIIQSVKTLNPLLFYSFLVCFILSFLSFLGILSDPRLILGINPWIKVLKFDLSVGIYFLTLIYLLKDLNPAFRKEISFKTVICLFIEIALITFQAARGVTSHFNQSSLFDGMIFTTMGIFIAYNTYLVGKILYQFIKNPPQIPIFILRSIQYGLATFLLGSFIGAYMSAQKGHCVGVTDGSLGLPFVNWSTLGGDLRVPHRTFLISSKHQKRTWFKNTPWVLHSIFRIESIPFDTSFKRTSID
jgi:hypothetical protein